MDRDKVEVGKEYTADLWGKKAKVRVLRISAEKHKTLAGKEVLRYAFHVEKEDGSKTVVAASKLKSVK